MRKLAILPILALCGLSIVAARQMLSDFFTHTAALEVEAWSRPGGRRNGEVLPRVIERLEQALAIAPNNSWALELLGPMQFETVRSATDPQAAIAAARASLESFRRTLHLRPTNAQSWGNLALAKQSLGEFDSEFFNALEQSARQGPWEPPVMLLSLQMGLMSWDHANPSQRELILEIRDRAVRRDVAAVNRIARDYNRPDLACDPKVPHPANSRPCPRPAT